MVDFTVKRTLALTTYAKMKYTENETQHMIRCLHRQKSLYFSCVYGTEYKFVIYQILCVSSVASFCLPLQETAFPASICFPKRLHVTQKLNTRSCLCQQTFYRNELPKKYSQQESLSAGITYDKMKYGSGTTYDKIVLNCVPNRLRPTFVTDEWDSIPTSSCLPTTYRPPTDHFLTMQLVHDYRLRVLLDLCINRCTIGRGREKALRMRMVIR